MSLAATGNRDITTSTTFADGSHTLTATQTDAAALTSVASAGFAVAVDPAAPAITTPVGQPVSGQAIEVKGTGEAGATVMLFADGGSTAVGTGTVAANGSFDITTSTTFADGSHTLTATQTDAAALTSVASASLAVVVAASGLLVSITGTPDEGSTLAAVVVANNAATTIAYQWQSLTGSTWTNIVGANKATYVVTEANEGRQLRVIATAGASTATSASTLAVTDVPPSLSVTVSGAAQEGQVLTATANPTSDADGGKTTYQWQELAGSSWVDIAGATLRTVRLAEATEGMEIRVLATFTDDTGQTISAISTPTAPVIDLTPTLTVTVNGTAQEGRALTAQPHITSDADGGTTTYQWQRLVGTTWTNINGATAKTYVATEQDEGSELRVAAVFTDDSGQTASTTSAATAPVIDIKPTLSVTVSGTAQEGQSLTAAAVANDSDAAVAFQWQRLVGVTWTNIAGATSSTYLVGEADESHRLRAVATSSDPDGAGTTANSTATASVVDPPPTLTISGASMSSSASVFVTAGGSVALPISVAAFDSDDKVSVTIAGLPAFETITDALDKKTFSGASATLTAAEVNSGLTLHSTYTGSSQPVDTLSITATNSTGGEAATSLAQTITVTDPPVLNETMHDPGIEGNVALLINYMAAFVSKNDGVSGSIFNEQSRSPWSDTPTLVHPTQASQRHDL
jgi:hypothetical protein